MSIVSRRPFTVALLGVVLMAACAVPAPAHAAEAKATKAKAAATAADKAKSAGDEAKAAQDAMMEAWLKNNQAGEPHKWLEAMAGKWKAVTKSYEGPGEPQVTEGTSEMRMVLGGRFLEQHFSGAMGGMPFEGWGITGYDNMQKKYVFCWADNMGTALMSGTGDRDESGKKLTVTTRFPMPDGTMIDSRMVTELVDANTHNFTLYGMMNGQEMKMMEITYTRM